MLYLFFSLLILVGGSQGHAELVDRISATVADEPITLSDLKGYKAKLKAGTVNDDLLIPDEKTKIAVLADDKKLLNILIDNKILQYEIKKQNLQATIEKVEQEIRSIAQRNRLSRSQLEAELKAQGTSYSEYQDLIKSQIERQSLIERAVNSKIKVSDEDVFNHYMSQHGISSGQIYEYTIDHILFSVKKNQPESEEAAMQRAELALKQLKNERKSFETLAAQYSDDPRLSSGGRLGTFKAGELSKEFSEAIAKLQVGEVSGIVKSRAGIHILKLESKRLVADPKLEAEKETIRRQLTETAFKKQFQFWLDQKRQESQSIIRINV